MKMIPDRLFGVILALYLISSTDCTVTLTHDSTATGNTFICGEEVKLTCKIEPLTALMTWSKDSVSETQCSTAGNCLDTVKGSYQFSSDVSIFEYYMTINPVAFTDAANFDCNDGTLIAAIHSVVKIIPTSATIEENGGSISVTTSCIYPQSDIEIKWYYVEDGKTEAVEYTPDAITTVTSTTSCTTGACTSGTGVVTVKHTFTYNEPTSGTLMDVNFRAVVSHAAAAAGSDVTQDTTNTYKMESNSTTTSTATTSTTTTTSATTTSTTTTTTTTTPPPSTSPPRTATTVASKAGDNSSTTLIIVLSVVGGVFILGIIITLLVLYCRKHSTDTTMKDSSADSRKHEKSRKQLRRTPMDKDILEENKTHDQYRTYDQYQKSAHYWAPDQNRVHGRPPATQYRMYGKQPINQYPMYVRQPGIQYQMDGRQSRIHGYHPGQLAVSHVKINPVFEKTNYDNYGYVPNVKKDRYERNSHGADYHDNRNYRNADYSNNWN